MTCPTWTCVWNISGYTRHLMDSKLTWKNYSKYSWTFSLTTKRKTTSQQEKKSTKDSPLPELSLLPSMESSKTSTTNTCPPQTLSTLLSKVSKKSYSPHINLKKRYPLTLQSCSKEFSSNLFQDKRKSSSSKKCYPDSH